MSQVPTRLARLLLRLLRLLCTAVSFLSLCPWIDHCSFAVLALLRFVIATSDIKPRDIMTRKAFENAVRLIMVTGGSTNATIHMIAMARSAGVDLTLQDFRELSASTPFIANLKPSGKYVMEDLHAVGEAVCVRWFGKYLM